MNFYSNYCGTITGSDGDDEIVMSYDDDDDENQGLTTEKWLSRNILVSSLSGLPSIYSDRTEPFKKLRG